MLAIRLRRVGSKKRPYFRVVVIEAANPRDGSFVEILGHYNPRSKPAMVKVDRERLQHWIEKGARPSDTVRTLIARHLTVPAVAGPGTGAAAPADGPAAPRSPGESPAAP
jgi:small subunit ribosomal protein S16